MADVEKMNGQKCVEMRCAKKLKHSVDDDDVEKRKTNDDVETVRMSRTLLTFLGFVIMYGPLQATMYSVALPEVQESLDCTDTELGLTMSVFIFAAAVFPLASGPIADRIGRKPVLLAGLVFFAIGSTLCAVSQNAIQMIGSRLVQGVGFAICSIIPITVISDLVPAKEKGKYVSYLYLFIFAGPSIGPLIGGFIAEFLHWRFIFVVLAVSSLIMIVLTPFVLPETLPRDGEARRRRRVSPIESILKLGDTRLLFPAISAAMSFGGLWVQVYVTPILLKDKFDLSPAIIGICMLARPLGSTTGSILLSRTLDNRDPIRVHIFVTIGGIIAMALFGASFHIHLVLVLSMLTAFGFFSSMALAAVDTYVVISLSLSKILFYRQNSTPFPRFNRYIIKTWSHKAASALSANKFLTKFWAACLVVSASPIGDELIVMLGTAGTLTLGLIPILYTYYDPSSSLNNKKESTASSSSSSSGGSV